MRSANYLHSLKICHVPLAKRRRAITRRFSAKLCPEAPYLARRARASIVESASETWRGDDYVSKLPLLVECSGLGSHTPTAVVSMETYSERVWLDGVNELECREEDEKGRKEDLDHKYQELRMKFEAA